MNRIQVAPALNTAIQLAVISCVFLTPLVFSIRLEDGFELPETLVALMGALFLALFLKKNDGPADPLRTFYWFFLIAGLASFIQLALTGSFFFSSQNYLWFLTAFFFLAPLGGLVPKRKFMVFAVAAGVLGSFYSFAQALGWDLAGWSTHFGGRSFSTLGNPIFWAGHLLVLMPLALYLALSARQKGEKFFWWGALAVLFVSLLATQTRGAWLGALGEITLLVLLSRRQAVVWKGLMIGIIVFLLTLLAVPALQERAVSILRFHDQDAQGRYFMWDAALKLWEQKPLLGQGPGGYAAHFHQAQADLSQKDPFHPYWTTLHAHNEYLETLAERGLVGFVLGALVVVGVVLRRLRRHDPSVFSTDRVELAILTGIAIQSLFNFPLSIVPTACLLALLFNLSWDQGRAETKDEGSLVPSNLKVFLGVVLVLVGAFAMEVFAQNARLHRAIDQIGTQQYEEALKSLDFEPTVHLFHYLDPRVLTQRAIALDALGRTEEAAKGIEELIAAYPEDADAHATLCMLYGKQKRWADAESEGSKALGLSPCHERALMNLAMASYLQGHKKDAVQYLSRLEQAETVSGEAPKALETQQKISALQRARP